MQGILLVLLIAALCTLQYYAAVGAATAMGSMLFGSTVPAITAMAAYSAISMFVVSSCVAGLTGMESGSGLWEAISRNGAERLLSCMVTAFLMCGISASINVTAANLRSINQASAQPPIAKADTVSAQAQATQVKTATQSKRDLLLESVQNQKLKNAVDQIYRHGATTGDGGLADAVRYELQSGNLVGGKSHILKATERVTNLQSIIKTQNLGTSDLTIANSLLDDILNALGGR